MQRTLLFLLFAGSAAFSQIPGLPPGANVPANANANLVNPATQVEEKINLPKINGERLAELYRKFTGRRVTVSVAASEAQFRFVQDIPLTYGEASILLQKAALLEGFVFVSDPLLENHDILTFSADTPTPGQESIPTIIDPADLPTDDRVVTYVMDLQHIKPDEVVKTFTTIVGKFGSYGSITPIPNTGSVVITEKTSLIKRLIDLKDEIDQSTSIATRFIKVQYADVEELAATLNEVLNTQQSSQTSTGVSRVQNNAANNAPPGVPGNTPVNIGAVGTGASAAAEAVPIQIVPDTRTNRIFAMGRPVDIVFIEGLVREFDTKTDERNFLRRKLRYVAVADFLNIAEPALERTFGVANGSSGGGGSTGANFGSSSRNSSSSRNNRSSNTSNFSNNSRNNFGNSSIGGSSGGLSGAGNTLGDPNVNTAPEARLVGRTLLVADNITNSLVVQGPPAGVEIITNLIDQIDVKAEQVMISAVFGQLSLGDDTEFGVDFLKTVGVTDTRDAFGGQNRTSPTSNGNLIDPLTLIAPSVFPNTGGLNVYGLIGSHWNVYLNALQANSRFNVLSRPTIYVANSQKGQISAGQRIAVPTNTFNSGGVNGATQSTNIEYQDVLLSLEVIPLVNSEDEVTLQISLLNDEIVGSQTIDGNEIPTIGRRELLTNVTVPNGATIVLGGLINSSERESVSGIPLLSDIPGLGRLFSNTTMEEDRQELMIFIQPRIVKDAVSLAEAQNDMDRRYDVSGDSREFSAGPGVLPEPDEINYSPTPASTSSSSSSQAKQPAPPVVEEKEKKSIRSWRGSPGSGRRFN